MDDFPWVYAAMILIAFVGWLHKRVQEAAEFRRRRALAKRTAAEERKRERPLIQEAPSPYLPPAPKVPPALPPTPLPAAPAPAVPEAPQTFREFFEILQRTPPAPARPPVANPPPLPVPAPASRIITEPERPVETAIPSTGRGLPRLLRNRSTLREAIVLKEILDTPLGLR